MRVYKKKEANDGYGYVPQANSQAESIEACLSSSRWKSVKEIYQEVNRRMAVAKARIQQHLEWHAKTGRIMARDNYGADQQTVGTS